MKKNQNKTTVNDDSVEDFLSNLDPQKRDDSQQLIDIMKTVTKEKPTMWGSSIIGFGSYHYKYTSGREGDWLKIGFSPRKSAFSLYLSCDADQFSEELKKFGNYSRGKSCIYFKKLTDIDTSVLETILKKAYTPHPHES